MTVEELPAQVASIIHAAASTATCTPNIVESLKRLLFVTDDGPPNKQHAASNHQRKAPIQNSRAKKTTGSRSRKAPQVTILEEHQIVECTLSSKEKNTLATQVVNNALRSLTAALKDPTLAQPTKPKSSAARAASDRGSGVNIASLQTRPLKPRCVNRPSTSPIKIKPTRNFAVGSNGHVSGLLAQAECACTSFAALRKLRPKSNSKPDTSEFQIESGVSALIGKLIALGFHDLAMRELVLLKKSLDGVEPAAVDNVRRTAREWHIEALTDLFRCSEKTATGFNLSISVAIQSHALRIIAARPSPPDVKIALLSIESESPLSLVNLIQRQLPAGIPGTEAKAAQQLESLVTLLLGLCYRASEANDHEISKSERNISPQTTFQLQTLAFKIRVVWWKLAQHKGEVNKEIWEPFSKCLATFGRSPTPTESGKYLTCKVAVEKLLDHVKVYESQAKTPTNFQERSLVEVYQKMAAIARDCSFDAEMDRWWRDARALLAKSNASNSRLLSMECRRTSLYLRARTSSWDEQRILQQLALVADKLNVDVAGDIEDFEDLFVSINSIRKSISLILGENHSAVPTLKSQSWATIRDHCETVLVKGIHYLGHCITAISVQKEEALPYERITKVVYDTTIPYVGSLVMLAKRYFSESDRWYKFDRCLEDCINVIGDLQCMSTNPNPTSTAARIEASLISICNVYWCRFLHLKKVGAERKALRRALDLSIIPPGNDIRPQVSGGLLPARLEQQGIFHETSKDFREAAHCYLRALHSSIAAGSLSALAEAAVTQPPCQLVSDNGKWKVFGRLLIAYTKAVLCIEGDHEMILDPAFGEGILVPVQRGLVLEQQIRAFDTMIVAESIESKICEALQTIASGILSIYTQQTYPIRRLRVINQLSRMHSANPLIFSPEVYGLLAAPVDLTSESISLSSDSGLQQWSAHLVASQKIYNTLCNEAADLTVVRNSLATWSTLLQDTCDNDSLRRCIDDIPNFRLQLECLIEYLEGQDLVLERLSTLKLLVIVNETLKPLPTASIVVKIMELGVQYSRLGNTTEAGFVLHKAQKYLNDITGDSSNMLASRWHLSYAEYSVSVGNAEIRQHISQAGENLQQGVFDWDSSRSKTDRNHQIALMTADFAGLCSMSAVAQGQPLRALYYGRRAVNTLCRARALLHGSKDKLKDPPDSSTPDAKETDLIDSMSSLTVSTLAPTPNPRAAYMMPMRRRNWLLVPRLFHSLLRLSTLYTYGGLSREAYYYMEQAQKVVKGMPSASYQARFHAQAGQLTNRSGDYESGTDHFDKAELAYQANGLDDHYVEFQLFLAEKYMLGRDFGAADAAFARANNTLDRVTDIVTILGEATNSENMGLEVQMDRMSLTGIPHTTTRPDQRATSETNTSVTVKQPIKIPTKVFPKASSLLRFQQARISRQRALRFLYAGDFDKAQELLSSSASDTVKPHQLVLQTLLEAQLCLRRGLESMAADLTFCVLPESTISCPSVKPLARLPVEASSQVVGKNDRSGRTKRVTSKKPARATKAQCQPSYPDFIGFLQQTQDTLSEVCPLAIRAASTAEMHTLVDVLSRSLIMSSSLGPSMLKSHNHPITISFVTELGRTLASIRERMIIQIEQQTSSALKQLDWLTDSDTSYQYLTNALDLPLDISKYNTEFIDIIPESWTLLSLSLSESRNEFRVSKLRSGHTPFVISIPLNRHSSRDPDEDTFGFDQGKAEMLDIANLANYSTHDAPDPSRKGAKTEWWEARAALDARLKSLLVDIEGIWFGGFRGIFSNDVHNSNLVLRFQQTLHIILERHLPSRQKATKPSVPNRVTLDIQVAEMFVALGNPDVTNLDEEMTDLLYFVIDILQFHGESNAYDEIDFDTITVDVLDALRQYHAAAEKISSPTSPQHTILVLDKALHCFPWESLPCLKPHAVSRVPSLAFLRDRVFKQQARSSSSPAAQFLVNPYSGTYVLNPSGDLTATQSRFEDSLAALPHWDGIVAREPSETELQIALSEKEILLYFGHGSGGQYIRPRTVKKLDKCAVALLMGCSSGTMTEAGTYESYGTPMNYMHAGCPAVVATLWDVTDKDIDRFSEATLEEWGLFKQQQQVPETGTSPVKRGSPVKRAGRKGGKQNVAASDTKAMSLDQAVAHSRDTCIMKYLNGAAPVVYGIPVFLSS